MKKDIRRIVKEGYELGDYPGLFRRDSEPNEMERRFLTRLLSLCSVNPRILDLGCGTGVPVDRYLALQGAVVTGVDISPKHISQARVNVPSATYLQEDFSDVDLPHRSFDAAVSFYAIFHIPRAEHRRLFERVRHFLKEGGIFLATLGASDFEYGEEPDWAGAPMAWSSYDPGTYKRHLVEANFEILESAFEGKSGDDEHHFWVLAQKRLAKTGQ